MRRRLIIALCLFVTCSLAASSSVTVRPVPESLQRPRIIVLLNGTPVPGATVEVEKQNKYPRHNEKLRRRLTTNGKGQVLLPKLPYGLYRIIASEPNLTADLYLNFSPGEAGKEGLFSLELKPFSSLAGGLAADERLPITKCPGFLGVVHDQSGASVPNVQIEIMQMGADAKIRRWRLHSNAQGKFSVDLADGDYIAFFAQSGFSTRVLHLAIAKTENRNELNVILQVGAATE